MNSKKESKFVRYAHVFIALDIWRALDKNLESDSNKDGDGSQVEEGTQG